MDFEIVEFKVQLRNEALGQRDGSWVKRLPPSLTT